MLEYLKKEIDQTFSEKGGLAYETTGSDCLNLFATVGALRQADDTEIILRFIRAYTEDPDTAMKLLFYARDIRGGLGERRVFRVILHFLAFNAPQSVKNNLSFVAEYGRYDDLLSLLGTPCEEEMLKLVAKQFLSDIEALREDKAVSLLGKWLPSVNASNDETRQQGKKLAKALGLRECEYRKALTALRGRIRILENDLREKDYSFDYAKQPSRALFKYRKAFIRNDEERYLAFLDAVEKGKSTLHTANVMPYELVAPILKNDRIWNDTLTPEEKKSLNTTWAALPDFGSDDNALAVIDNSGSMYSYFDPMPAAVAMSLGLYFAEHNTGAFRNSFITFSDRPQLIELKGETFADRLRYALSFSEVANTNLEAVFDLILRAAIRNNIPQEELPARLVIISDMEYDACVRCNSAPVFETVKERYARCGYRLPEVVFWNVASRNRQQPVTQNEQGVALVSGTTPRIFSMLAGGNLSPYRFMMDVLGSERYAKIAA